MLSLSLGQSKPPKHSLLLYGIQALTRNVELIQTLNRLGHAISYSQLEENDTALSLQKLGAAVEQQKVLPETIQPDIFTQLAWGNIDLMEETLTGAGTTHRVNGIAIQPKIFGPQPQKVPLPHVAKTKQCSVTFGEVQL